MASSLRPGVRLHHLPTPDIPRRNLTMSGRQRGSLAYFCRHQRPRLNVCSWLLSSLPSVIFGNVNQSVQSSPAALFTNNRPPCIPITSCTMERFICSSLSVGLTHAVLCE